MLLRPPPVGRTRGGAFRHHGGEVVHPTPRVVHPDSSSTSATSPGRGGRPADGRLGNTRSMGPIGSRRAAKAGVESGRGADVGPGRTRGAAGGADASGEVGEAALRVGLRGRLAPLGGILRHAPTLARTTHPVTHAEPPAAGQRPCQWGLSVKKRTIRTTLALRASGDHPNLLAPSG